MKMSTNISAMLASGMLIMTSLLCTMQGMAQSVGMPLPPLATMTNHFSSSTRIADVLPKSGKVMFIFYDAGCGHCQMLGQGISKQLQHLKHTAILFVAFQDKPYVEGFMNQFAPGLKNKTNVSFWKDVDYAFYKAFMPQEYPSTYIFDAAQQKLLKVFSGEGDFQKILPYLH